MTKPERSPIRIARGPDDALIYLIDVPPTALPPVRTGDLAEAWHAARHAAAQSEWGTPRLFRFIGDDGPLDLALADEDACCWMQAVDSFVGLAKIEGLSLCMRLLALIDLIAKAPWASRFCRISRAGATLDPALLRVAATIPLTDQASFDETVMRDRLATAGPASLTSQAPSSGVFC